MEGSRRYVTMNKRVVKNDDIELHRRALVELGGEASLEQVAERTGETDLYYVAACLIVPEPTQADPTTIFPFAIPSAWGRDPEGRRTWRTERHWTADDLEDGARDLGPLGGADR